MKTDILSLKSLYRFLTINDYPVYSGGIITKKNHRGLTLTRFWQENILYDFRDRRCGRQIWRSGQGRNRYISDICNRSRRLGCYGEYAEELCDAADGKTVLRQIQQFMSALTQRNYNYEIFCQKLPAYIRLLAEWDDSFSGEANRFFTEALAKEQKFARQGSDGRAFYCGWFLALLMLHALSGNGEGESALSGLRADSSLSLEALDLARLESNTEKKKEVTWLTGKNSELCCTPLSQQHFFGREEELFELREMLVRGGKYLISGMGGIGKTELMRQLLWCCEEEGLADYICVVQYEGSLMTSFVKAFPGIHGTNAEDNFDEILERIRVHEKERVLIVIDNMNEYEEESLAALERLPATIFITSRFQELKGFAVYPVRFIDRNAGKLIFRDNYERTLTAEDKHALSEILKDDIWRHTLTLRLLGRAAAARGWAVAELKSLTEQGGLPTSAREQGIYGTLQQMYHRMYQKSAPGRQNGLLRVFAVLPCQSYTAEFAERFLAGLADEDMTVEKELERLYVVGRLEKRDHGYSMHPFMAECVRSGGVREKDITPFVEAVYGAWRDAHKGFQIKNVLDMLMDWGKMRGRLDEKLLKTMQLIPPLVLCLTGKCSRMLSELVLIAYGIRYNCIGSCRVEQKQLELAGRKLAGLNEDAKLVLCVLQCMYGCSHLTELERECALLLENPAVGRREKALLTCQLGLMYYESGSQEKMERMLARLDAYKDLEYVRETACVLHASAARQQGNVQDYEEWLLRGYEACREEGHEKGQVMREILTAFAGHYYSGRQFDKAERYLREFEENFKEQPGIHIRIMLLVYRGGLAMYREDEGFGTEQLGEACRLARNLCPGADNSFYIASLGEFAMACNKAGRREEAEESYQRAIVLLEHKPGHEFDRFRMINNMSVMYLDWEKPGKALFWLEDVRPFACEIGGLGFAESSYNLSRAWQQLGDREKELQYLKEAAPLLEQYYGGEHPKVKDAKRRLTKFLRGGGKMRMPYAELWKKDKAGGRTGL